MDLIEILLFIGHDRVDKSMFGSLEYVLNEDWYTNEENLYINFAGIDESHVYKIFSTFVCTAEEVNNYTQIEFSTDEEFSEYIQNLKSMSTQEFNTDIENTDKIITLYTCYETSAKRLMVCAKLVD